MAAPWDEVAGTLDEARARGVFPGACALVARGDRVVFEYCCGSLGLESPDPAVTPATVWDLASLTKPLVTVALTLILIDRGRLGFDDRVASSLPAFGVGADPRRGAVTLRHLLHHDSGLPAHRRFFDSPPSASANREQAAAGDGDRRRIFEAAVAEPLERDPGAESVYSDVGFLVLGALLEAVSGERIDRLARRLLLDPLEVEDAWFVELGDAPRRAAGSAGPALQRVAATGSCSWRGRVIHGVVQDENAYAMGGVAPHAGLFATARAVHALALEWSRAARDQGRVLCGPLVRHAWERASGHAPSTWALGWDTPSPSGSSAGNCVSDRALGHLGYTGTSLWIDCRRSAHVVLLTNRVASDRKGDGIRALRPRFHDAVFRAIDHESGERGQRGEGV